MPIHKLKLIDKQEIASNTIALHFEKPDGFTFKPGQYGGFTLIDPHETDANGITRRFSLLSTPNEKYLSIALRIPQHISAYKRVLKDLPIGSEVKFAGPTGTFTLHEEVAIPAVFIAGGIGITPFRSMIRHATETKSTQQMTLFYGNQKKSDAAFLDELATYQNTNPQFKFIATLVEPDINWQGEAGYITHTMLKKYIPDLAIPIYYICGSPVMVTALQELLAEMGIDEGKIKVEDFPGY